MASIVKSVTGNTTLFTVTDVQGNQATISVVTGAVTGNVITYGGSGVHDDATAEIAILLQQLQTGLIPGAGAQNLLP